MSKVNIQGYGAKSMSVQKRNRELIRWASTMGVKDRRIDPTGSRLLFTGTFGGEPISVIISKTPGDHHAEANARADIKRQMKLIMNKFFEAEARGRGVRREPPIRLDGMTG